MRYLDIPILPGSWIHLARYRRRSCDVDFEHAVQYWSHSRAQLLHFGP